MHIYKKNYILIKNNYYIGNFINNYNGSGIYLELCDNFNFTNLNF